MRLVVHAGIHRTGTTTLQRVLADNRAVLGRRGVAYPGTERSHQALAWALHRGQSGAREVLALVAEAEAAGPGWRCSPARTSRSTPTSTGCARWRHGTTPGRCSTCGARTTG